MAGTESYIEGNQEKFQNKQIVRNENQDINININRDFQIWKTGDTDTEERNLPEMSEKSKRLLSGMSKGKQEESNLWETMGKSFMKNKVKLMNSLWGGKDSDEMKAVKVALDKLSGFYQTGIGGYFKNLTVDPETGKLDLESLVKAKTEAVDAYDALVMDVITSAGHYLSVKNPFSSSGKARYNNVKQLKEQLENERGGFEGALGLLVTHISENSIEGEENDLNEVKFSDVLRVVRAEEHTLIGAGGGGANTFSFVENHKKKYFKTNEKTIKREDMPDYFRSILEREIKTAKSADAKLYTKLLREMDKFDAVFEEAKQDVINLMGTNTIEQAYEKYEEEKKRGIIRSQKDIAKFERCGLLYDHRQLLSRVCCMRLNKKENYFGFLDEKQDRLVEIESEGFADIINSMNDLREKIGFKLANKYHSLFFTSGVAGANGINEKCVVTMRSVATSRMADKVTEMMNGDRDYAEAIVRAKTSIVKTEKGYKSGIVMDEAKGSVATDVFKLALESRKPLIFSTKAAKQYNFIMIFDFICGQMDRHRKNFMMDYTETAEGFVINSVQAIDNDFSFGKFDAEKLKNGSNRLCPMVDGNNSFAFKYIDEKLKDAILNMDDTFISYIKHQFADCQITGEQIEAMKDRIQFLQEQISNGIENESLKVIENEEDWTQLSMGQIIPKNQAQIIKAHSDPRNMSDYLYHINAYGKKIKGNVRRPHRKK